MKSETWRFVPICPHTCYTISQHQSGGLSNQKQKNLKYMLISKHLAMVNKKKKKEP